MLTRYVRKNKQTDERMNRWINMADKQHENIMSLPTMLGREGIKLNCPL